MRITFVFLICIGLFHPIVSATTPRDSDTCIPLYVTAASNRNAKIDIRKPGRYCLQSDIHARFDFADHPAEGRQIHIWGSDVELDLSGHTLGRGRFFVQTGGIGIELEENSQNIKIKNGTLENFEIGVYRTGFKLEKTEFFENPVINKNTYTFVKDKIILENITFKKCTRNWMIHAWE
jgi:hypothetical protein